MKTPSFKIGCHSVKGAIMIEELLHQGFSNSPEESTDFMNALFSSVDDGIIVSDQNGKIIFCNDAALRINDDEEFPIEPGDRISHYSAKSGDSERHLSVEELPIARALLIGEVKGQEVILTSAKGRKKILVCNGRSLYNKDRQKIGAVLVFHDDTVQQDAKQKRSDLEKERLKLLHINSELENFSAIAAHDLKSPLNSITQFAEHIKDDFGDSLQPEAAEMLQYIVNAGNRMRTLIDDLLTYARAGEDLGKLTSFDLHLLVEEVKVSLQGQIEKTGASLEIENLPVIYGDRVGVSQLFTNLLSNALKYRSHKPPIIKVKVACDDRFWQFQVEDNGIGIQAKDQSAAFDLFKRVEGSQQAEGTGLGLPICKRVVEFHGGKLWIESEPGRGSTFFFTLPKVSR